VARNEWARVRACISRVIQTETRALSAAIRALDARADGNTYRAIAEALFGKRSIPDIAGKRTTSAIEPSVSCKAASH